MSAWRTSSVLFPINTSLASCFLIHFSWDSSSLFACFRCRLARHYKDLFCVCVCVYILHSMLLCSMSFCRLLNEQFFYFYIWIAVLKGRQSFLVSFKFYDTSYNCFSKTYTKTKYDFKLTAVVVMNFRKTAIKLLHRFVFFIFQ